MFSEARSRRRRRHGRERRGIFGRQSSLLTEAECRNRPVDGVMRGERESSAEDETNLTTQVEGSTSEGWEL